MREVERVLDDTQVRLVTAETSALARTKAETELLSVVTTERDAACRAEGSLKVRIYTVVKDATFNDDLTTI